MQESTLRSLLRVIAVVTVLLGAALTSYAIFMLMGATNSLKGMPQEISITMSGMGDFTLLARASVAAWGIVLYLCSPWLARRIAR